MIAVAAAVGAGTSGIARLIDKIGGYVRALQTVCYMVDSARQRGPARDQKASESIVIIGERLRQVRIEKGISQGEIEKRTKLVRSYISRVENGHIVPTIPTLEKMAQALGIQLFELFYEGEEPPTSPRPSLLEELGKGWGSSGEDAKLLLQFEQKLNHLDENDQRLLLAIAKQMIRISPNQAKKSRRRE